MADAILAFVSEHRDWAFAVAFALSFLETLMIVSAFVPTTAVLIGAGAFVAAGSLDFAPLVAGAAAGAALGSVASWTLGRVYGPRILRLRMVRRTVGDTARVQRAFVRWGAPVVAFGHLSGPFRSVAFTMAGLSAMPLWRFVPMTVLGAILWAWAMPMIGKAGGDVLGWLFGP